MSIHLIFDQSRSLIIHIDVGDDNTATRAIDVNEVNEPIDIFENCVDPISSEKKMVKEKIRAIKCKTKTIVSSVLFMVFFKGYDPRT